MNGHASFIKHDSPGQAECESTESIVLLFIHVDTGFLLVQAGLALDGQPKMT